MFDKKVEVIENMTDLTMIEVGTGFSKSCLAWIQKASKK